MRILITGASGRLGTCLADVLGSAHAVIPATHDSFDITDWQATRRFISDARPEVVVHPAAWTDVDGCATDPDKAFRINGIGAGNVALAASEVGASIVYISSNEVFPGEDAREYREYDLCAPANPYGYSKWVGERAVVSATPHHMIVRVSWLFAHGGRNFIHAILGAVTAGKPLRVVTDETANPTYANDAAAAIARLIDTQRWGIYHFTNEGYCSRYDFARYVLDQAGYSATPIEPITRADWPRPSTPPAFSPLANHSGALLGIRLRPWQQAVSAFLQAEGKLQTAL